MSQQPVVAAPTVNWYNADRFFAGLRRVNLFCGGYGSGKTEVAVNFALHVAAAGRPVSIADLDIVNPYFRSREVRDIMRERGIEVLVPRERMMDADMPVVQPEIQGALAQSPGVVVLDLGGDPAGARVMASIVRHMKPDDCSGMLVLNSRRPFTATAAGALRMMTDISVASGVGINRLVVNSHLIDETGPEIIDEGIGLAEEVCAASGAEIAFVTVERRMLDRFDAAACRYPVMVLDRFMLPPWRLSERLGRNRFKLS